MTPKSKTTKRRPPSNGKTFSKDYQPSGAAKSAGRLKKRLLSDILEAAFKGPKGGKLKAMAAAYIGIPEETITVEDMLHFRQIERAIKQSNTFAYQAVLDRAYGKPKQPVEELDTQKIVVTLKNGH